MIYFYSPLKIPKYANIPASVAVLTCPQTTSTHALSRHPGASVRRTGWWATAASLALPAPLTLLAVHDHHGGLKLGIWQIGKRGLKRKF